MRRLTLAVVLVLIALPVSAQEIVSVTSLLVEPAVYDNTEVTVLGELVGDFSRRGDEVWLQLNDDEYVDAPLGDPGTKPNGTNSGIGVRVPASLFDGIVEGPPGRYGWRGPKVTITGTFLHLDPALGGETYVDGHEMSLVESGRPIETPGVGIAPVVGAGLGVVGIILFLGARRRRETPSQ